MKRAKLILLDNPIIVTDEEIKDRDNFYAEKYNTINRAFKNKIEYGEECKKIIPTNKQIDYNGIDFGVVDVEKLAELSFPDKSTKRMD